MTFASMFAILVGVLMIGPWLFFYFTNQIPELVTEPYRIIYHLAGEIITALSLTVAGAGLLVGQNWASWFYFLATGMIIYTIIVSPGYFAQKGQWAPVAMFAVLHILATVSVITAV